MRPCSITGCGRPVHGYDLCKPHLKRKQNGTEGPEPIGGRRGHTVAFLNKATNYTGDDCLVWPYCVHVRKGYGKLSVDGHLVYAHRVVCELVHGMPPSPRHKVAHQCGNPACVAPKHLRWATQPENEADKVKHGRTNRAIQAKLGRADVLAIRAQPHRMGIDLAAEYGVSPKMISKIRHRITWAWLEETK
jgi:hypothetical protein